MREDPEAQESIHWLQNNQMPWELVLQHWHKTFNIRRVNIEKSEENMLFDIFTTWPILKHPHGYSLIIDFKRMTSSEETLTIDKWDAFFHRLTSCVTLSQKDDQLQFLMETLRDTNINEGKFFKNIYCTLFKKRMYLSKCFHRLRFQGCFTNYDIASFAASKENDSM